METRITATQLARSLSDILSRVKYRGERFIIERNGEPVAVLGPAAPEKRVTWAEFVKRLKEIPPPDDDYWKDLEEIQASQPKIQLPPKWD
ncbi:MAG: type II toxin-antitoxin system prevent-host-death family antitoxin [Chloroflexi bacterium]|nr:type II toxin-antitoxin system prevent-host-death family antitoxin [Chloroflexota bacterium]